MLSPRAVVLAVTSAACSFVVASGVSCGTDAVGVSECRKIEAARCEAATNCEGTLHVGDADACTRFYRDHCLHGLKIDDAPGRPVVDRCVNAIDAAGRCARRSPKMTVGDCADRESGSIGAGQSDGRLMSVCQLIERPESAKECDFLVPPDPPTDPDTSSAGGANGSDKESSAGAAGESADN